MVIYPLFIRVFYFTHQSIVLSDPLASSRVVLVESTSPSHLRRVIASLSRRRRVNRVSASHPRVVMVPHRVILAESSSPRRVLE